MTEPATRDTQPWSDWELDLLESHYALHGTEYIQGRLARRGIHRPADSIRQKATRLNLAEDMLEFTPAPDVTREAGVSETAVLKWLEARGYRRHCRTWGREVLIPLPAVRLYLHERRAAVRPSGWLGSKAAASKLNVTQQAVLRLCREGDVVCVTVQDRTYFDPYSLTAYREGCPAPMPAPVGTVPLAHLARALDLDRKTLSREYSLPVIQGPGLRSPQYATLDHARAFLTARGHREEQVEMLLRRALALDASKVKSDEGEPCPSP